MVKVPYACVGGGCGYCKVKVIDGQYVMDKYAKSALSDEEVENGYVLLCKTHPLSDLQLEWNTYERGERDAYNNSVFRWYGFGDCQP